MEPRAGLQFHVDYSAASMELMLRRCASELDDVPSLQKPGKMLPQLERIEGARHLLFQLLDAMAPR